ncbi:hypothetical protein PInf_009333 [Phytophthora infestans]|nr:hypothetical protein PInf_009333 [Phytophthora infestans]
MSGEGSLLALSRIFGLSAGVSMVERSDVGGAFVGRFEMLHLINLELLAETLEELLYEEFVTKRTEKEMVTRSRLANMAIIIYARETKGQDAPLFAASDNWVSNFMIHFEISLRRQTNLTTLEDDMLVDRAVAYDFV